MDTVERSDNAVRLAAVSVYGARFTDLVVRYGEVVVLTGPNGVGKSTVSRAVVGELAVAGSVQVLGTDPVTADLKGRIGYLVKDLETMGSLTSRDVLDICAAVRGCGTAHAHQLAGRLGLELDRPMSVLSHGQLRRLGIVQALMHEPELVVLDDPMTELDDAARQVLPALLHEAAAGGAAVLVTAQAGSDATLCAGRVVELSKRAADDSQDDALSGPRHEVAADRASIVRDAELGGFEPVDRARVPQEAGQKFPRRLDRTALSGGRWISDDGRDRGNLRAEGQDHDHHDHEQAVARRHLRRRARRRSDHARGSSPAHERQDPPDRARRGPPESRGHRDP
ncbi:ABC-type multidrug transport system ATPase subunit [Kribbella solani]|uniref:ABC-type multidrug transport system ATPase subunit n=1 Tax=Kribbella solani TaxID=236067 RepID=A0A841DIN1_9ACTN|nr:ABC-type multidrug transport system ATPase subunit [Kribbella solani]